MSGIDQVQNNSFREQGYLVIEDVLDEALLQSIEVGQPSGRPAFPSFIARSLGRPERVTTNARDWTMMWKQAHERILSGAYRGPIFNADRWRQHNKLPVCAWRRPEPSLQCHSTRRHSPAPYGRLSNCCRNRRQGISTSLLAASAGE